MPKSTDESAQTSTKVGLIALALSISGALAAIGTHRSAEPFLILALFIALYLAASRTRSDGSSGGGHRVGGPSPHEQALLPIRVEATDTDRERRSRLDEARRHRRGI